jgi:multicomponent Na+:H+ antiporter subunit D
MLSFFPLAPLVIALIIYLFPVEKAGKIIAVATQTALSVCACFLFMQCKAGEIVSTVGNYGGGTGISLKADTLSSVFIMLTAFIFLAVTVYSYNSKYGRLFWLFLFIWQGLLNGLFLAHDLFNIFVLIELVTVVVAVMMMHHRDKRSIYDGMLYLMVNTVAVLFYLFGVGIMYKLTGVLDLGAAADAVGHLDKSQLLLPSALILTALSLKCALVPLYSWLPKAHSAPGAPTAASAVLSGLHIKSSLYLFVRFTGLFSEVMLSEFFLIVGIITGIVGFLFALAQTDIKLILAYHTISQIGMIMIGLSIGDVHSYAGGIYHMINHALFKSALFLCAGMIARVYGTRDIYKIRGVMRRMPLVGAATVMAVLGITGTPLFNGSISKYFITSGAGVAVTGAIIFINFGTIISFIKYTAFLFGRSEGGRAKIERNKQTVVMTMGVLCLAGGLFGQQTIAFLFGIDVSVDRMGYLEKVLLFILSLAAGYVVYKYIIARNKPFFAKMRRLEFGFRGICTLMGAYFAVLLMICALF